MIMVPRIGSIVFAIFAVASAQANSGLEPKKDNELRIHVLNVGDGNCVVAECPKNPSVAVSSMIFDCGSSSKQAAMTKGEVQEYLNRVMTKRFIVVLSHPDKDHYNLLPDGSKPDKIYAGGDTAHYKGFSDKGLISAKVGDTSLCGAAQAGIIAAGAEEGFPKKEESVRSNISSIVSVLIYGEFRAVFPGDATAQTLASLLLSTRSQLGWKPPLLTNLLVASHHGSSAHGENGFLWDDVFRPQIVVFSSGGSIKHPTCVSRYAYREAVPYVGHAAICYDDQGNEERSVAKTAIFSTRNSGVVVITTDGKKSLHLQCLDNKGKKRAC